MTKDSYAAAFRPKAQLQEREADAIGAAIFFATGFDLQRALGVFDKLSKQEIREDGPITDSHDAARTRKQAVSEAIAELQQFHARSGPSPR
jgi:predicted Zn-dependent protease